MLHSVAHSVLDLETGKSLEHHARYRHPNLGYTWSTSYSNKPIYLYQGIGADPVNPTKKRLDTINTFHTLCYEDIPPNRRKGSAFSKVGCNIKPDKYNANHICITTAGQNTSCPVNIGTKTASLDLIKIILKSVLSRYSVNFATFDIKNVYLQTPLASLSTSAAG